MPTGDFHISAATPPDVPALRLLCSTLWLDSNGDDQLGAGTARGFDAGKLASDALPGNLAGRTLHGAIAIEGTGRAVHFRAEVSLMS